MKKVVDGNTAVSLISYKFSELASIYPITPSSPMAKEMDLQSTKNIKNLFGNKVDVIEMQSEAGASGVMHGALLSGTLASTYTASQGLLLMIPNMYKIAGEGLPGVMHVASRTIATHALSIFGDHSDIYAVRQTGWCMLASSSVQDAHNLAAVAHLSSIKASLPFLHFFDGFRTSHEINKIDILDDDSLYSLIDFEAINKFRKRALNINNPKQYGMAENADIYFQSIEARNEDYNTAPDIVNYYMNKINKIQGTNYKPFNYYGDKNAKFVIVAMGSVCQTIRLVIDDLIKRGHSIGLIEVHLYRPFSIEYLEKVLPKTVRRIAVLDKTKEHGSIGEPLYLDILSALKDTNIDIYGGRYGISSKDVEPKDIYSVFNLLECKPRNNFTIGINDDVTNLSLDNNNYVLNTKNKEIVIYGYGSDGMVSASKDILKILGETTNNYVQGYFDYDSKKSGGVTVSNLRFGNKQIEEPYFCNHYNILVVTKEIYLNKFDMTKNLAQNGILIINTNKEFNDIKCLSKIKKDLKEKNITIFTIDANSIADACGIKGKISIIFETILLRLIGIDNYKSILINNIKNKFMAKGEDIVNANIKCINISLDKLREYKGDIILTSDTIKEKNIFDIINDREGNNLKVSDLLPYKNGEFPSSLTKYEKRKVATKVPVWNQNNCIECGLCSMVCPHAVIRPFILDKDSKLTEDGIPLIEDKDNKYKYIISVSEDDCTACGLCINICPGKKGDKALSYGLPNIKRQVLANTLFNSHINPLLSPKYTIKGSQLIKPKFEFSGACSGCGETAYIKLLTQLFGDKLIIANATGCSSIYGGSAPSTPYSIPWANSLFEDNAEFGFGIYSGYKTIRNKIKDLMIKHYEKAPIEVKELFKSYIDNIDDYDITKEISDKLKDMKLPSELKELSDYIEKPSIWAIGGDGWAYDIGFSGIDHVLSSGENINILVLDTEVYSNTGGQASKSSHIGQVAEFAQNGKKTNKKDMFKIAMSYDNVYVASISLGANPIQTIRAFKEAEEHNGPSIIIAYAPCVEQGIKKGMSCTNVEQKLAVECGYNLLMRYNGKTLTIDSKEPNFEKYEEYLNGEVRYNALSLKNPKEAEKLLELNKAHSKERYEYYLQISQKIN